MSVFFILAVSVFLHGIQARRALRAVRGLGRLKSLIQGQSVKRQATSTLRCMQTLARVQSQVRSRRIRMSEENKVLQHQLLMKHEKELNNIRSSVSVNPIKYTKVMFFFIYFIFFFSCFENQSVGITVGKCLE